MSKGGMAKVYFVLYLAIVVELLIIIVERDEAEEHLHKLNNESMRIVESILSQLYSGSGTQGINTRPQDEITLPAEADMAAIKEIFGTELKTWRQYQIDVGVSDVTLAIKRRERETSKEYEERIQQLILLANVEELEYQIFFSPSESADTIPAFHSDDYIRDNNVDFMQFENGQSFPGPNGENWSFVGAFKLVLDREASYSRIDINQLHTTLDFVPVYKPLMRVGNGSAPRGLEDSAFFYSDERTRDGEGSARSTAQKRSFIINFEPPDRNRAGVYKLRFASKTNRILGVASLEEGQRLVSDEESKINIGTVQLTVRDLKKVATELRRRYPVFGRIPSVEELSTARGNTLVTRLNEFRTGIEAAFDAAMVDSDADLVGKIRLYEYITNLIVPGQSINFDQNRSNFDINVRVQTARPSTARPYVAMVSDNRTFTNARHVFEIEAGPYKGNNRVTGRVLGPTTADITFTQEGSTPERDKQYRMRGVVSRELPAGRYVMEISHEIQGRTEVTFDTLYVFEAGIRDESRTQTRFANRLVYGGRMAIDFLPNSETTISAAQFKTIFTFDGGIRKEVQGYRVTRDAGIEMLASYSRASVNLVWIQPITYREFSLFQTEAEIKLDEPIISPDVAVRATGNASRVRVEARGLVIFPPSTGLADANARVSLSEPTLRDASGEINGYTVTRQPEIVGGDADNGYTIEFELSRNPGTNVRTVEGTIVIPVTVVARHPTNGKTSRSDTDIMVNINFTPTGATGGGGRPPGGTRPQQPQPQRPPQQQRR